MAVLNRSAITHVTVTFVALLLGAIALAGCGEGHKLTQRPVDLDIYVDSTFSNDQVAGECMPDVMEAAKLTAGARGLFTFHTFDGDPFRRRGLKEQFGETSLPADVKGTRGETAYLEGQAEELEAPIEALISEPPTVGGTPLVALLERAGRHTGRADSLRLIVICTDGLFTDVNPLAMTLEEARATGETLPAPLRGVTIDFIGLDGSAPGRGRRVEQTKPLVRALLDGAGTRMGNWDLELPPAWREDLITEANQ
jgi:hypothetical protein